MRTSRQLTDGPGDAAREIHPEPAREQHDDQSDQHQREDIAVQDRLLENPQLKIILGGPRNVSRAFGEALRKKVIDHHRAYDVVAIGTGKNRRAAADDIGATEW